MFDRPFNQLIKNQLEDRQVSDCHTDRCACRQTDTGVYEGVSGEN